MGRPWPQPGEPLFLDEDVEEILDFIDYEDSLCSGCHQPRVESFDPANEWSYRGETLACHACAAKRRAEKKLDVLDGVYSYATKKPGEVTA